MAESLRVLGLLCSSSTASFLLTPSSAAQFFAVVCSGIGRCAAPTNGTLGEAARATKNYVPHDKDGRTLGLPRYMTSKHRTRPSILPCPPLTPVIFLLQRCYMYAPDVVPCSPDPTLSYMNKYWHRSHKPNERPGYGVHLHSRAKTPLASK